MPPRRPLCTDEPYAASVKNFYRTVEEYDWVDVADHLRGPEALFHRYRTRRVLALIRRFAPDAPALDVGCGTGLILRRLPPGSVGIDLNPRHARRIAQHAPHATFLEADAEALPRELGQFDLIICAEVLEHLVYPERALQSMRDHLAPGGVIVGSTPRRSLLWRFRWLSSTHMRNEPFHNEFTERELRALFRSFTIETLERGFLRSTFFFVLR